MTPEEEHCESCEVAVLGGMTLRVCRNDAKDLDCQELYKKFTDGEISVGELVHEVKRHVTNPDALEELDEIEKIAKGE